MADADPPAKRDDRASGPSLLRTVVLYFVVALTAAAISGWYLFAYVPSKLEYFLGLRFRTLTVAAGQLKSKGESLSQALTTAKEKAGDSEEYLQALVPELKTNLRDGLELDGHRIAWGDLVAQASAATEANFDDLVLTDGDGNVVWQRERTSPRIGSLTELLERKPASDGSMFSVQWRIQTTPLSVDRKPRIMPATATSNSVRSRRPHERAADRAGDDDSEREGAGVLPRRLHLAERASDRSNARPCRVGRRGDAAVRARLSVAALPQAGHRHVERTLQLRRRRLSRRSARFSSRRSAARCPLSRIRRPEKAIGN